MSQGDLSKQQAAEGSREGDVIPPPVRRRDYIKWLSLVLLTCQASWHALAAKHARASGALYLNSSVVLISEVIKLFSSIALLAVEEHSLTKAMSLIAHAFRSDTTETLKLSIPALAYCIMNSLFLYSLDKLSAVVQQVTYQLKVLTAAGWGVAMLGKSLTTVQWMSLLLLIAGVLIVQVPTDVLNNSSTSAFELDSDSLCGFLAVLAATFISGFAGVFMEMMLKKKSTSLWLRNIQLAFFGAIVALMNTLSVDHAAVMQGGFLQGFNSATMLLVFTLACGGLLVAMVLKYADNILRQFSTALSILITGVISSLILGDFKPDLKFAAGSCMTISATFLYNLGLPCGFKGSPPGLQSNLPK